MELNFVFLNLKKNVETQNFLQDYNDVETLLLESGVLYIIVTIS